MHGTASGWYFVSSQSRIWNLLATENVDYFGTTLRKHCGWTPGFSKTCFKEQVAAADQSTLLQFLAVCSIQPGRSPTKKNIAFVVFCHTDNLNLNNMFNGVI